MKSWSDSFRRRVERRKRAARLPKIIVQIHGFPEHGPILPGSPPCGPLVPWQVDLIERITAERNFRLLARQMGRRLA